MDVSDSDSEEEGQVRQIELEKDYQLGSISIDTFCVAQAFYAGGSSTSGNVILGPKKKKFNVGDVFKVGFLSVGI